MNFEGMKYLIVGSGFWGSVIAERIASVLKQRVVVIDKRNHIGGSSYSSVNKETGIECHNYGTHIFHTSNKEVWNYIQRFGEFTDYQHKVYTVYQNRVFNMPINLNTINAFFNLNLKPSEAKSYIKKEIENNEIKNPSNLEEKAMSLIGSSLYQAFIRGYTQKQWEKDPKELPAAFVTRLPVRYNYNCNYFDDLYQGLPRLGYSKLFENMLSDKNIEVRLGVDFFDIREHMPKDCKIIFTGAIDQFFNYKFGNLKWRSLRFEEEVMGISDYQGTSVMNYADSNIAYTRIHEFKHLHPEREVFQFSNTIICREYPKTHQEGDEPYYPITDSTNNSIYQLYSEESNNFPNVIFGGRLGSYKYWNMDKAIENALLTFETKFLQKGGN